MNVKDSFPLTPDVMNYIKHLVGSKYNSGSAWKMKELEIHATGIRASINGKVINHIREDLCCAEPMGKKVGCQQLIWELFRYKGIVPPNILLTSEIKDFIFIKNAIAYSAQIRELDKVVKQRDADLQDCRAQLDTLTGRFDIVKQSGEGEYMHNIRDALPIARMGFFNALSDVKQNIDFLRTKRGDNIVELAGEDS